MKKINAISAVIASSLTFTATLAHAQSATNGYTVGVQRSAAQPTTPQIQPNLSVGASTGVPPISQGQARIEQVATVNAIPPRNVLAGTRPQAQPVSSSQVELTNNRSANPMRLEGFNEAVEQLFPMTPEMIERMRQIQDETEKAIMTRAEPEVVIGTELVSLEPGAVPPTLNVTPGVATVISVYDVTGAEWPVEQYVLGDGQNFQIIQLGEESNSLTVTPLVRIGWTNLILRLKDNPTPIVVRVSINERRAHYRHDLQVMAQGPEASITTASASQSYDFVRPGNEQLVSVLTRTDIPEGATPVSIAGVSATAYQLDDVLYIRSRHALLSPSWTGSISGPDGMRVYRIDPTSVALFSVDGSIVRADLELPR